MGPLVVGVGASSGVPGDEVVRLVSGVLTAAGLPLGAVVELATVEARAAEPGLRHAAALLDVPLVAYPASELAGVRVPHPSPVTRAAVGTPSVAEAAALLRGGRLVVPKTVSGYRPARATCAVALLPEPAGSVAGAPQDPVRPAGHGTGPAAPGPAAWQGGGAGTVRQDGRRTASDDDPRMTRDDDTRTSRGGGRRTAGDDGTRKARGGGAQDGGTHGLAPGVQVDCTEAGRPHGARVPSREEGA